jgi:hypothetical protein
VGRGHRDWEEPWSHHAKKKEKNQLTVSLTFAAEINTRIINNVLSEKILNYIEHPV